MQAMQHLAQPRPRDGGPGNPSGERLSVVLRHALRAVLEGEGELPRSARDGSAAALAQLIPAPSEEAGFPLAHYHGEQAFFPADLVSLFYLAGVYLRPQNGGLPDDEFVKRDVLRMMRAGDCDAANLIFDRLTGTLSGPELPEANLEFFARRRGRLDNLLRGVGVRGTRCEQKIWERAPFGRDAQFIGADHSRDNQITAISVADLLAKVALGQVGGEEGRREQLDLLQIDPTDMSAAARAQPRLARGLPAGSRVWGRRAVGARILHEVTAVELPGGCRYVLVFLSYLGEKHQAALEAMGRGVAEEMSRLE